MHWFVKESKLEGEYTVLQSAHIRCQSYVLIHPCSEAAGWVTLNRVYYIGDWIMWFDMNTDNNDCSALPHKDIA